jgi:hypothetical protein
MARIFAYIAHKGGIADDSAAELASAAKKIDAAASPVAVVTGWGAELDAVCETLRGSYAEVWKIANQALAYPNAELVRKALLNVLPQDGIVLVSHSHFGIDLSPGRAFRPACRRVFLTRVGFSRRQTRSHETILGTREAFHDYQKNIATEFEIAAGFRQETPA